MKKFVFICFLEIFFILVIPSRVFASTDEVASFHSDIVINQDTSISITEQIDYTTDLEKHGIYRYIPTAYNHNGQKEILPVRDLVVTNGVGLEQPFTKSFDGKFVTLKIGDPDVTFTGKRIYH